MWHPFDFWSWWLPASLWMLIFWGLVIWAIVTIIDRTSRREEPRQPRSNAMAILKERFARGEITREEFEEMRRTLRDQGS